MSNHYRRRRSPSQWHELIHVHRDSGLSLKDFCLQQGLDAKYFSRKRIQLGYAPIGKRCRPSSVDSAFVPVAVSEVVLPSSSLVLKLNAVELCIPAACSVQWLSSLLRSLR